MSAAHATFPSVRWTVVQSLSQRVIYKTNITAKGISIKSFERQFHGLDKYRMMRLTINYAIDWRLDKVADMGRQVGWTSYHRGS